MSEAVQLRVEVPGPDYRRDLISCQAACPVRTDARGYVRAIAAAFEAAREEAAEGLYLAVLGPGGVASPREVAYRGMGDPGQILSDILAFHEAFAFRPETEEPPDHVAVEAGFLG